MSTDLKVLLVEDSPEDAELVLHHLRRGGFTVNYRRVMDRASFVDCLERESWDVVISDFALPRFNGLDALATLRSLKLDVPFLLVSGTIGEEEAVHAIKAGAQDYLLKDRLSRLAPAVERALREVSNLAEQRHAEAALRDNEQRFRLLVETVRAIPWEAGGDGVISYIGPQAERLLGHPLNAWYEPGFWTEHIHPDDHALAAERLRPAALPTARSELQYRLRHADGSWRWFLDIAASDQSAGQATVVRGFLVDVTQAKESEERRRQAESARLALEQQLLHAQKLEAIGTLAGGIAHDFNNILTSIGGFSHLLERCLEPGHRGAAYVAGIALASKRAQGVVSQILTFSRRQEPSVEALDLTQTAREVLQLLRATIPSTIEFVLESTPDLPQVLADPGQLNQVLMNLGTNACHAMQPAGGTLTLHLGTEADGDKQWVVLRVSDTGVGMTPEVRARIFEPFFSTKPKHQGTGLGMAVVHGIIHAHHGTIALDSAPGMGTSVTIRLPAQEIATPAVMIAGPAPTPGTGQEILVIDDEPMIGSITGEFLVELGFKPHVTARPQEGLRLVAEQPGRFALVLTDLTMPQLTGTQVAERIMTLAPHLPVVLTSGNVDAVEPQRRPLSIRYVLVKPYTIEALAVAVQRALAVA